MTIPKGRAGTVPLKQMPLLDQQFKTVAVDFVGLVHLAPDKGKRYTLTFVGNATRYLEAVALSKIDTETVAKGLIEMYSRI